MAEQELGTDRGFISVVQGGPLHLLDYFTQIRKVKTGVTTIKPGLLVSGNGETEGEVDLAAADDQFASFTEIVLEEVGFSDAAKPDIDDTVAAGAFVKTLRPTGLFIVAAIRADESNNTELGEPMVPEATGMLRKWAYTDTDETNDVMMEVIRCAEVTADVAGTDLVQLVYF